MTHTKNIGRYELSGLLGKGGMGTVHLAMDPRLQRPVAVKTILFGEHFPEEDRIAYRERFEVEALAAANLNHPNIVTVYDCDQDGDTTFIVMEYVDGMNLHQLLNQGVAHAQIPDLVRQAARALDHAHSNGVLHRDIKPANFMLRKDGVLKLTDFGIAKFAGHTGLTRGNTIPGTVHYLAPELIGDSTRKAHPGSDQYALGAVAFELLTGHRPIEADSLTNLLFKILHQLPPLLSGSGRRFHPAIDVVFGKVLSKQPAGRYPSCVAFAEALADAMIQSKDCSRDVTEREKLHVGGKQHVLSQPARAAAVPRPRWSVRLAVSAALGCGLAVDYQLWKNLHADGLSTKPATAQIRTAPVVRALLKAVSSPATETTNAERAAKNSATPLASLPASVTVESNPKDRLLYVRLPAGRGWVGCVPGDRECKSGEKPGRLAYTERPFRIAQTEVTVRAYKRFLDATARRTPNATPPGGEWRNENYPVTLVSLQDAQSYCAWIGGRLPSEQEWEFAARAGSENTIFTSGDRVGRWDAKFLGSSVTVVRSLRPNTWGVHDLNGNVEEWVLQGTLALLKGGHYASKSADLRISAREIPDSTNGKSTAGFRCVW